MEYEKHPRSAVFEKMERLIKKMQQIEPDGVEVFDDKGFISFVPAVCYAGEIIRWLDDHLHIYEEFPHTEAEKLATCLCQYGYIFPVADIRNLVVTERQHEAYFRFQSPNFWSSNKTPDSMSYAIHLVKRSSRNRKKHGLDPCEQLNLEKLKSVLCDQWQNVITEAQAEVKRAKARKKAEKIIHDSQERAFWNLHKPSPGCIKPFENGMQRNYLPRKMAERRKNLLHKEVRYLKNAIALCRTKNSKAIENLETFTELHQELDPMLISPVTSNPWFGRDWTDDSYFKKSYTDNEILTEAQIKKWSYSLRSLLGDQRGLAEFEQFLRLEYSSENLSFWRTCEELKFCRKTELFHLIARINENFLTAGSQYEVNIDSRCSEEVQRNTRLKKPNRFTFDKAQEQVFNLMKKDTYQRFLRSDQYKHLLANASQPGGKKKFFSFGSSSKKKTTMLSPSPKPKRRGSSGDSGGVAHSYSTGNLHDLDDKQDHNMLSDTIGKLTLRSPQDVSAIGASLAVPPGLPASAQVLGEARGEDCVAIPIPVPNVVAPWEDVCQ